MKERQERKSPRAGEVGGRGRRARTEEIGERREDRGEERSESFLRGTGCRQPGMAERGERS